MWKEKPLIVEASDLKRKRKCCTFILCGDKETRSKIRRCSVSKRVLVLTLHILDLKTLSVCPHWSKSRNYGIVACEHP